MAIQQHPLPQDISAYRFRLIGDMTIKQFGMLAAGIILAVVFFSSPLPFFFRYPLSFLFLVLGIGAAFVPVQGRPLEQWIIAFIKSIYSPTQYIWRQSSQGPQDQATTTPPATFPTPPQASPRPAAPQPAAISTPTPPTPPPPVESPPPTPTPPTPPPPVESPTPTSTPAPEPPPQPPTPPIKTEPPQEEEFAVPAPTPSGDPLSKVPAPTTTLPIPFTPTTPNTLVGLTLTPDGKILESVLVEILAQGLTIRATKSNRLGQFLFARPLENGRYQIAAEKNGFKFSTYSIELKGDIIAPLKIQAESETNTT